MSTQTTAPAKASRRTLIRAGALTALSYARILGANDRIQVGQIGCGHRAVGHRRMLKLSSATDPNFDLRSVCDLWSVNRERAAADADGPVRAAAQRRTSIPRNCWRIANWMR